MTVYNSDYLVEYKDGSWASVSDSDVLDVQGSAQAGLSDSGVAFGDESLTHCTLKLKRTAVSGLTLALLPIRVTFTINAASQVAFVGEVASASGDLDTVTLECESMLAALPGRTRDYYSPLRYRRPPFTKTTASSIEDPDNGSYQGGLGNELFWRAAGRPYEQAGTYPTADFYYSCEQAIRAPDWSWVAGENGYEEIKRLARAVGGQISAGMDGVIRYKQPLTMVGTATKTYNYASADAMDRFKDLTWRMTARDQYAKTFTCAFTPRRVQPTQEVISDTTYRVVPAGTAITFDLEPHWPLYSVVLDGGTLKERNITATRFDGQSMAYHGTTGYTVVTTVKAMQIALSITNHSAFAMQISKIVISGQPVAAGETQTVTVGSGDPARVLEDNIFVQTRAHALALAAMALAFHEVARRIVTLKECVYDTARVIWETVNLTVTELGLSAAPYIILAKPHQETGVVMDIEAVDAAGLPALADYWLIKSTSQSGTKKVAW